MSPTAPSVWYSAGRIPVDWTDEELDGLGGNTLRAVTGRGWQARILADSHDVLLLVEGPAVERRLYRLAIGDLLELVVEHAGGVHNRPVALARREACGTQQRALGLADKAKPSPPRQAQDAALAVG